MNTKTFAQESRKILMQGVAKQLLYWGFNDKGEVEYIFVNPAFRKQGVARKLLKLTKEKLGKELTPQEPISPLGKKLFNIV